MASCSGRGRRLIDMVAAAAALFGEKCDPSECADWLKWRMSQETGHGTRSIKYFICETIVLRRRTLQEENYYTSMFLVERSSETFQ